MSAVVGLDPSLTAAGIAVIESPLSASTPNVPSCVSVGSGGSATDTDAETAIRIRRQAVRVIGTVGKLAPKVSLVVIEGLPRPNPNAPGRHSERCALYWEIVAELSIRKIPVAVCKPTTLKLFGTGDGKADKRAMVAAARELWPHARIHDDNQADALLLATAGAYRLRWYEPELPNHIEPRITWPKGLTK